MKTLASAACAWIKSRTWNAVGRLKGSDPSLADQVIVPDHQRQELLEEFDPRRLHDPRDVS